MSEFLHQVIKKILNLPIFPNEQKYRRNIFKTINSTVFYTIRLYGRIK
jgi:hypothetical protein